MPKSDKTPKIFTGTKMRLATSTKHDGHMSFNKTTDDETVANIESFVGSLNWPVRGKVFIRITYGEERSYDDIVLITKPAQVTTRINKDNSPIGDAAITNLPGVCLLLPTADCYPITVFDPEHKVLAMVHMGWQSTAAHLIEKVVKTMAEQFNSYAADLLVHIGPGIPAEHYTFKDPAQKNIPGWEKHLKSVGDEHGIDLLGYNLEQLSKLGVPKNHIEIDSRDTINSNELESHHQHSKGGLPTAQRFLTAVMMS